MLGLVQDRQLLLTGVLGYAARHHASVPVVSRKRDGSFHISNWAETERRVRRLAAVLLNKGIGKGDRVATLAWNNHRHLEIYFAAAAIGAVCHPINPRLFPEQVVYIAEHADDSALFYDLEYESLASAVTTALPNMKLVSCLGDAAESATSSVANVIAYETLIADASDDFAYPEFDERTAASLCYTSGTTGNPKGVLVSHRALILHAMGARTDDLFNLSARSIACAIVPLYHAHASWGLPFAAAMSGASLILPGLQLDGAGLTETFQTCKVSFANGVPTIWQNVVSYLASSGETLPLLQRVVIAGSAPAPKLIETLEQVHNIHVCHIWGMTETGPSGTSAAQLQDADSKSDLGNKIKQGHGIYNVEMRIANDKHAHCPWGEDHIGQLQVRGPYIISGYYKGEGASSFDSEGWFTTGDVASIDNQGYLRIIDRDKDLVKSGGEWISSIDVENTALSFPGVQDAAVIAMPHETWGERPLLIIVNDAGATVIEAELMAFLRERLAKWWLPDRIVFTDSLPRTGTGKVMKVELRKQYLAALSSVAAE